MRLVQLFMMTACLAVWMHAKSARSEEPSLLPTMEEIEAKLGEWKRHYMTSRVEWKVNGERPRGAYQNGQSSLYARMNIQAEGRGSLTLEGEDFRAELINSSDPIEPFENRFLHVRRGGNATFYWESGKLVNAQSGNRFENDARGPTGHAELWEKLLRGKFLQPEFRVMRWDIFEGRKVVAVGNAYQEVLLDPALGYLPVRDRIFHLPARDSIFVNDPKGTEKTPVDEVSIRYRRDPKWGVVPTGMLMMNFRDGELTGKWDFEVTKIEPEATVAPEEFEITEMGEKKEGAPN